MRFEVANELEALREIPTIETERLTLTELRDEDRDAYNALCLDDERNRWWGYDYREDLVGELTEDYFLSVAREDFRQPAGGELRRPPGREAYRRGCALSL